MRAAIVVMVTLVVALYTAAVPASARVLGDSRVVLQVPPGGPLGGGDPGFPEGIAIDGRTAYVSAPAQSGNLGDAKIYVFNLGDGALVKALALHPPVAGHEHGIAGIALDGNGRLYIAGQQGLMRLDPATGTQSLYATFPNLPPCVPLLPGPCSPTLVDRAAFPNDVAFDAAGNAYVSDSWQATVWRVPPGPGAPQIWCQGASLDGAIFGPNGIRLQPDGSGVTVTVTGPPGGVFALDRPGSTCQIQQLRSYPVELPDGLAFGRSGRLYVTLAGTNQVSVLSANGAEQKRYSGPAVRNGGGTVPWDAPASVAVDPVTSSLLVVNHALVTGFVDPSRFVVFDVFVDDRPVTLKRPVVP